METFGLIDNKNSGLWNELLKVHEIEIRLEDCKEYGAFSQNGKTVIHVPQNNISPASFTHELLHVFLRVKKVFIGASLKLCIREKPILSRIFSQGLLEHIGNCLDHAKMFPMFLKIGYDKKDFLLDYSTNKLTNEELNNLKTNFVHNSSLTSFYNASAIDFYIGKYFAIKTCPNDTFSYENVLNELKQIDTYLFFSLEKFIGGWTNFDYNSEDPIESSYHLFTFEFVDEMENWIKGKQII